MATARPGGAARSRAEGPIVGALAVAFIVVCLAPHLDRLTHPSLYADDVVRVAQLQANPLGALLFRPFNEHVAPCFEAVSWLTWALAGRRLTAAPRAFTLAAFVPFGLASALLGRLVRREVGSTTAAL